MIVGNGTRLAVAVIGAGKMACDCVDRMLARDGIDTRLVITSAGEDHWCRRLAALCAKHEIRLISAADPNDDAVVGVLEDLQPDLAFNINSLTILRRRVLSAAPGGMINFHNGPLPAYAGLNIPTWVIWNDESRHGVTWHFMTAGIDSGNILAQSAFPVSPDETASSLMFKCILAGIELFEHTLDRVISGDRTGTPQMGDRSYYGRRDVPNDGVLELGWDVATLDRFLRAFDYWPFPNPVAYPRLQTGAGEIRIARATVLSSGAAATVVTGTVIESADDIRLATRGGELVIQSVVDPAGRTLSLEEVAARHGLESGSRLPVGA